MSFCISRAWLIALAALIGCQHAPNDSAFPAEPEAARFLYDDVDAFWRAFDDLRNDDGQMLREYLTNRSAGVRDFIATERIDPDTFAEFLRSEAAYYEAVRPSTLAAVEFEASARAAYARLEQIYPSTRFPPTYFVVGQTFSGGTATANGMIVGIETFSRTAATTSYGRPTMPMSHIPFLLAHELVHFQQLELPEDATLLQRVLHEGGADFIAELISGPEVTLLNGPEVYAYGDANADQLMQEFMSSRHTRSNGEWLYAQTEDRPQNLGYWVGYQIAAAYYRQASNKRRAIQAIILLGDGESILRLSGLRASG